MSRGGAVGCRASAAVLCGTACLVDWEKSGMTGRVGGSDEQARGISLCLHLPPPKTAAG
jgi:hypothetical protein